MTINSILIVDDSEADQFINQTLIKKHDANIEILQAYDGQEALNVLDECKALPDLILLDINMPGMNGHEFLEVYSTREYQGGQPSVVILTSSNQDKDKSLTTAYDCVLNYFEKPLLPDSISTIFQEIS